MPITNRTKKVAGEETQTHPSTTLLHFFPPLGPLQKVEYQTEGLRELR